MHFFLNLKSIVTPSQGSLETHGGHNVVMTTKKKYSDNLLVSFAEHFVG